MRLIDGCEVMQLPRGTDVDMGQCLPSIFVRRVCRGSNDNMGALTGLRMGFEEGPKNDNNRTSSSVWQKNAASCKFKC